MTNASLFTHQNMNLANKITLLRILAILPVLVFVYFPTKTVCIISTVLFIIASLSDMLDGYIARREGIITNFGKFLDPLADKLLICSVFIGLVGLGWVPSWIVILIIIRELAVTGLRAVAADEGIVIAADKYGKLKTIFQILALIPLIFHYPFFGINMEILGMLLLVIALLLTLFSGANYFYMFYLSWKNGLPRNKTEEAGAGI